MSKCGQCRIFAHWEKTASDCPNDNDASIQALVLLLAPNDLWASGQYTILPQEVQSALEAKFKR